jgi:hypothetical protein
MFLGFWMDFFGLIFTSVKTMSWSESPGHVSTLLKLSGWFVTTRSRVLDPLVGCFTSCAIPLERKNLEIVEMKPNLKNFKTTYTERNQESVLEIH